MDNNQYPATGGLFAQKEKRTDKSPDYSGMLNLEIEVVNDLIKQKEEGIDQPKINLVGWKKLSKAGNPYLRLIGNIERERQEQQNGYAEPNKPQQQSESKDELDDEIPF
jgi:hypothetical protein|tara:strand:- start:445 stop:771 length:327 start_codon:yes stop_codon:yes gene_type:complete